MHSEAALFALGWAAMIWIATAHNGHENSQKVVSGPHKSLWYNRLPGDGGKQVNRARLIDSTFVTRH